MNRLEFLIKSALVTSGAFLPVRSIIKHGRGQNSFTPLRRNVGIFIGQGGTIGWLANKNALVAVDSQYPKTAQICLDGLKEKTSHSMDFLVNTHHHGDHTSGNPVFKKATNHIIAHQNVPALQKKAAELNGEDALKNQVYADITFEKSWKKDVGDETIHATYYGPAHTSGDAVIYFEKANVAHMGDLVFNRAYPYIDRPAGASVQSWLSVLTHATSELPDDTIFIFGHGNENFGVTGKKADVLLMKNYLSALLEFTQKGIAAGKTKEEIAKALIIPGFDVFNTPGWSLPLSVNIGIAYDELTNQ